MTSKKKRIKESRDKSSYTSIMDDLCKYDFCKAMFILLDLRKKLGKKIDAKIVLENARFFFSDKDIQFEIVKPDYIKDCRKWIDDFNLDEPKKCAIKVTLEEGWYNAANHPLRVYLEKFFALHGYVISMYYNIIEDPEDSYHDKIVTYWYYMKDSIDLF